MQHISEIMLVQDWSVPHSTSISCARCHLSFCNLFSSYLIDLNYTFAKDEYWSCFVNCSQLPISTSYFFPSVQNNAIAWSIRAHAAGVVVWNFWKFVWSIWSYNSYKCWTWSICCKKLWYKVLICWLLIIYVHRYDIYCLRFSLSFREWTFSSCLCFFFFILSPGKGGGLR